MTAETIDLLRAAREGDRDAEARVLEENQGLIRCVERRFAGRGIEGDDLHQLACIGFIKAVRGYDDSFGTAFSTYAVPKIAGEIRRFLRDDGQVKVSRRVRENAVRIRWMRNHLEVALGREPTLSELAEKTGIPVEEIALCDQATQFVESMDDEIFEDGASLHDLVATEGIEDGIVLRQSLQQAVAKLPDKLAQIILLRYGRDLTQVQTARLVGVSQVQVSRLEKKALALLREEMTDS